MKLKPVVAAGVLGAGVAGAGEQPQPQSPARPGALVELAPLEKAYGAAASRADAERGSASRRWESTAEHRELASAFDAAKGTLERAGRTGTAPEKLVSSRAYNVARLALANAIVRVVAEDAELRGAERSRDAAWLAFDDARRQSEGIH